MTEYRRINTGITNADPNEMYLHKGTHLDWNHTFIERLNDYNNLFNELFMEPIKEQFGMDGWAVKFIQFTIDNPTFLADVYVDDPNRYQPIKIIIESLMPAEIKVTVYYRGTVAEYLRKD